MDSIPIEKKDLDFLNDIAKEVNVDYFNFRCSQAESTSLSLLNGVSRSSNSGIGQGFSVQTFIQGGWGLAVGVVPNRQNIEKIFRQSAKLAKWSSSKAKEAHTLLRPSAVEKKITIPIKVSLSSIGPDEKIRNLLALEKQTRDVDSRIVSTQISYSDLLGEKIIFNSVGTFIREQKSILTVHLNAIAAEGRNQQTYSAHIGELGGYENFKLTATMGSETGKNAVELLNSKPAKPGKFDIIMDPKLTGTFIHEAFGHACEADSIVAKESILADKIGSQVGSAQVNVFDDATMAHRFGWVDYDDEGFPGQKVQLIKNGKLQSFINHLESASLLNLMPTGNGRAASTSDPPIVRMSNTYLDAGDWDLDEMIKDMKHGMLCIGWQYGYTNPIDGAFQFKLAKAYLIENGEKTQLMRDAAISGQTLDVLARIDALSKKVELDSGHCGKEGQSMPVTSGGPYTRARDMVVGGQ